MNNSKYFFLLALLLGLLGFMFWRDRTAAGTTGDAPLSNKGSAPATRVFESSPWQDEAHWLVETMVSDLAELAAFAAEGADLKEGRVQVTVLPLDARSGAPAWHVNVTGPGGEVGHRVELSGHLWAVESYAELARSLLDGWAKKQPRSNAPAPVDLATALTTPDSETLTREITRVSGALQNAPLAKSAHEEAALLLGTLAWRESAGAFTDIRLLLSRMTTHMVMAAALGGETGPVSSLNTALQLTLIDRQTEALTAVENLPEALNPWKTALKMRATGDWRLLQDIKNATLLELLAHGQARRKSIGATGLLAFLQNLGAPPTVPDWSRQGLAGSFSVGEGHVFTDESLQHEFAEAAAACKALTGEDKAEAAALLAAMALPETRAVVWQQDGKARLQAVSWGTLASWHVRHLLHVTDRTHYFYEHLYGVPAEAAALREFAGKAFSNLPLFPLLLMTTFCQTDPDPEHYARAIRLMKEQPQRVTAAAWAAMKNARPGNPPAPAAASWFGTSLPFGTLFEYVERCCLLRCARPPSAQEGAALSAQAPYLFDLLSDYAHAKPGDRLALTRELLEPLAGYHLEACRSLADLVKHDVPAYIEAMHRGAALDPDMYRFLGNHLVEMGRADEAASAYELALDHHADAVALANRSEWLLQYFSDKGDTERVEKVAAFAEEVFSARGLQAVLNLRLRQQQWAEARRLGEAILERYGDTSPLMRVLYEGKDKDPEAGETWRNFIKALFPEGMKTVALPDFKQSPKHGVLVATNSDLAAGHGIQAGHVIVALDGFTVEDTAQYMLVRGLEADSVPLRLIIWDGTEYREVTAQVPERKLQCQINDFVADK